MWQPRKHNKEIEKLFVDSGQHKLIARLLSQRNILSDSTDSKKFISCNYNDLSNPHALNGIKEAAELFCKVAKNKGNICVIGDYDADGVISSTMIKELCSVFGLECSVFLPSRLENGYGLNKSTISSFKQKIKNDIPDLLFIVDCGCNSNEEIKLLKEFGIKHVIVIDHHIIDSEKQSKSADVLINWHLQDDFGETCSCGEIFHFIRGVRWLTKKVNPIEFLTYASIGILADVSPIIGDNRIIVKNGLGDYALNHIVASGFTALLKKSKIYTKFLSQEDVLFKIAPRINAVGRLHKPDIAFNLMIENDLATAELMAENLSEFNDKRKIIQKKIEKEAIKIVKLNPMKYEHGIVLYNPEWPIGVVGIVASKVVETFNKPTLIIGKNGDIYKGSGRSLDNINLKKILDSCKDMFVNYGGHAMAAGVTIKNDCLEVANELFNKACSEYYKNHKRPTECSYYDAVIPPKEVSIKNAILLIDTIYPYCSQFNPEPIFLLKDVTIKDVKANSGDDWKSLNFVAEKNGESTPLRLRMFSSEFGTEIEGKKADIYISLPQGIDSNSRFSPQANVIEIVAKK